MLPVLELVIWGFIWFFRYSATTVLTLLQEVANFAGAKINWEGLVKKTSTGISNAREYQMLWRHLAYRHALLDKLEDNAEPLVSSNLAALSSFWNLVSCLNEQGV